MIIREVKKEEYAQLGQLMVEVYSSLGGFPGPLEDPEYYSELSEMGKLTEQNDAQVLVATSDDGNLLGGVAYFSKMLNYGAGEVTAMEKNCSGIRLLGVDPRSRGQGVGRALVDACIKLAKQKRHAQVILHTTSAMEVAWKLYLDLGFNRSTDLDFKFEDLCIYGFRLMLRDS